MKEMMCTICMKPITSDALVKKYCKFCAMAVDTGEKFCCKKCEIKYNRILNQKKRGEKLGRSN